MIKYKILSKAILSLEPSDDHIYTHPHTHARTHTHTPTHTRAHPHPRTPTHAWQHIHTPKHARTHPHIRTRTHIHTHTHTNVLLCCGTFHDSVLQWSILVIVQRDATQNSPFIILQVHSTCFGCQPHPSSGVH